jgi:hypothetical protein
MEDDEECEKRRGRWREVFSDAIRILKDPKLGPRFKKTAKDELMKVADYMDPMYDDGYDGLWTLDAILGNEEPE